MTVTRINTVVMCLLSGLLFSCGVTEPQQGELPPQNVLTTIALGGYETTGICVLNSGSYVYATDWSNLYVVNTNTNQVVNTIDIGGGSVLGGVCVDEFDEYLYVVSGDEIAVVGVNSNTVEATVPLGYNASIENSPCILPGTNLLYVPCEYSNVVVVVDTDVRQVIDVIMVGDSPRGVVALPDGSSVYVTNFMSNTMSVIRTVDNVVVDVLDVGNGPRRICILPDGSLAFVSVGGGNIAVFRLSDNTLIKTIELSQYGWWPEGLCPLLSEGAYIYVANKGDNSVSVISSSSLGVVTNIELGFNAMPIDVCSVPSRGYIYVLNSESCDITVIGN